MTSAQGTLRDVSLARDGPDPLRREAASDDPPLGWRAPLEGQKRYLPLQDDIASTALWYQSEPHAAFPVLPDLNGLEVV
jgi:hypothetical protein